MKMTTKLRQMEIGETIEVPKENQNIASIRARCSKEQKDYNRINTDQIRFDVDTKTSKTIIYIKKYALCK